MLVLTRREKESVRIGDDVIVTVLGVKNGSVRLGVAAPKSIPVHRDEVYDRICAERRIAVRTEAALEPAAV